MPVKTTAKKIIKGILPYGVVRLAQNAFIKASPAQAIPAQSYYCNVLSGLSLYNFSINSDMTVSCNCGNFGEQAVIGDLSEKSLKEIFCGEKAEKLRSELLAGRLPIDACHGCAELVAAPHAVSSYHRNNYHVPKDGIMIENCSLCNYSCTYCDRAKVMKNRAGSTISIENMEKIAKELSENEIKRVHLFKFGESFMDDEIFDKVKIIREHNPGIYLHTSTNGMMIDNSQKAQAALMFDQLVFSIDGLNTEMLNKYQKGASFDKVMENVKNIKAQRGNSEKPMLVWKYVVFSWNDSAQMIEETFDKAIEIGFDRIRFTFGDAHGDAEGSSPRYFEEGFIPARMEPMFIGYSDNFGMEFDLSSPVDTCC